MRQFGWSKKVKKLDRFRFRPQKKCPKKGVTNGLLMGIYLDPLTGHCEANGNKRAKRANNQQGRRREVRDALLGTFGIAFEKRT